MKYFVRLQIDDVEDGAALRDTINDVLTHLSIEPSILSWRFGISRECYYRTTMTIQANIENPQQFANAVMAATRCWNPMSVVFVFTRRDDNAEHRVERSTTLKFEPVRNPSQR